MGTDFDLWADVYDLVYSYVSKDIPFYTNQAVRSGGTVLELGCGTGRVSIPIAEAGVKIIGMDSSPEMLRVADSKAKKMSVQNISLIHGDMIDFSLGQQFELIIIPFRGFLSLLSVEEQKSALSNIKSHLAPHGRLIFNVFVPDLDMLVQPGDTAYHLRDVSDPGTNRRFVIWHQSGYDNHNQLIHARVIVDELDEIGTATNRFYRDFQLRYGHRWEYHHLLTASGFEIMNLYGDFDLTPFEESSSEMIWEVCVNP